MKWQPQDFIAIGLLIFIFAFLIILWDLVRSGVQPDGDNNKELVIYIVGVLSGYLGLRKKE